MDFELLQDKSITSIILIGRFKWDVRVRLEYANIDKNKIIMLENWDDFIDIVLNKTKGNIYTMVCFDMTAILKEKFTKEGMSHGNN